LGKSLLFMFRIWSTLEMRNPRKLHLSILLCTFSFLGSGVAFSQNSVLRICNAGGSPLAIGYAYRIGIGVLVNNWTSRGINLIPPRSCSNFFKSERVVQALILASRPNLFNYWEYQVLSHNNVQFTGLSNVEFNDELVCAADQGNFYRETSRSQLARCPAGWSSGPAMWIFRDIGEQGMITVF